MATIVTHVVDPDNGTGTDYTSMAAWEAAQQRDLVAADEVAVAKCRCTGGTADGFGNINGWTTDATRYIKVWTDPAEGYRAPMKRGVTGNFYRTVSDTVYWEEDYVWLDGLHIVGGYDTGCLNATGVASVSNCYKQVTAGGINAFSSGNTMKAWNCIADGVGTSNSTGFRNITYGYNLTAYGFRFGFVGGGSTWKNCLAAATSDEALHSGTMTNCACDDASGSGSGLRQNQTFTFVDEAGGDFHLDGADAGAKDFGTDLSADANLAFSDDIDGDARSGSWDIGADEVAGGTETTVTGSGSMTLGGGAAAVIELVRTGAGPLTLGGAAAGQLELVRAGAGGAAFTGLGSFQLELVLAGAGAVVFGGLAPVGGDATVTGSGSLVLAGAGLGLLELVRAGQGQLTLGGAAQGLLELTRTGTGQLVLEGGVAAVLDLARQGAGAVLFTGAASMGADVTVQGAGTLVLSGTAPYSLPTAPPPRRGLHYTTPRGPSYTTPAQASYTEGNPA